MYSRDLAYDALRAHREAPEALGPALRALRLLQSIGGLEVAREVALAFVRLHDGDERAGAAVLAFAKQAPERVFGPGEPLTREGEVDDHIFVLTEGTVDVERSGVGVLAQLGPGASVGEIAPVSGTARTASVIARVETRAICIPGFALAQLREHFPGSTDLVARHARARLLPQLIGASSPFAVLPRPEREALFERLSGRTIPAGTVVVRAGLPAAGLYLIAAGQAEASRDHGSPARLGPGDHFGDASSVFDAPEAADVVARTPLTLFLLAPADLRLVLHAHPEAVAPLVERAKATALASGASPAPLVQWLEGLQATTRRLVSAETTPWVISTAPPVPMRGRKVSAAGAPTAPARIHP